MAAYMASLMVLLSLLAVSNVAVASADKSIDQLQKQLIDLRADVDSKSEELSLLRQENKQKRKFILSQIGELQSSIEHKSLVIDKIDNKLKKNKIFFEKVKGSESLIDELDSAINELTGYVSQSLPFKKKERLQALEEMHDQLVSKAVSAPRLANKLWAFVEDEMVLVKGNGVYRQIIRLGNEEKLVDVARVGMMMLYYRDGEGNVGMANKKDNQWVFAALNTKDQIHQVHYLFDSFQKQVRFGEFTLPNALSGKIVSVEQTTRDL